MDDTELVSIYQRRLNGLTYTLAVHQVDPASLDQVDRLQLEPKVFVTLNGEESPAPQR